MSNYDRLIDGRAWIEEAQNSLNSALHYLYKINPDGGTEPVVITPIRFEASYRALSRHLGHGHDYYDQWTPAGQRSHRKYARAVLEGAGFTVQEAT